MFKIKPTRLLLHVFMLLAFYACTTKNEVPQPVVDTTRVDALRTELMALQQKVLGAQQTTSNDSLTLTQLQAEITKLKAYLSKTVSYTVNVSSFLFKSLSGAKVEVSQGGKIVSGTTTSSGSTTFNNLYAGIITATVDLNGFARLVFRADIRNKVDDASSYSTTSQVLMLPLGGTNQADSAMTLQYWKLYANYNMVDDTLGGADCGCGVSTPSKALPAGPDPGNPSISYSPVTNQTITAYLNQYSFLDQYGSTSLAVPVGFTGWDGSTGYGQVTSVTYENAKWVATAGTDGRYVIKLPATDISNSGYYEYLNSKNVLGFVLDFGEFTHDYKQYTDGTLPYIIKNPVTSPPPHTYTSTFVYRVDSSPDSNTGLSWTSVQSTTLSSGWSFFYQGSLK